MSRHLDKKTQRLSDVGEDGLLREARTILAEYGHPRPEALEDDVGVTEAPEGHRLLWNCDAMVEGTHFRWWDHPLATAERVGEKLVAVNVSDLAAKGAQPRYGMLTLGVPNPEMEQLRGFYRGLAKALQSAGALLIGGDTVRSDCWMLSLTLVGTLPLVYTVPRRHLAKPGDYLYLSGSIGGSCGGFALLEGQATAKPKPSEQLILRELTPEPRLALGIALRQICSHLATMDISDGLAKDASRMAASSNTAFHLEAEKLPIHKLLKNLTPAMDPLEAALFGGEDYELLFATDVPPDELTEALNVRCIDTKVTCVGRVAKGCGVTLRQGGEERDLAREKAYEHFY